jgi:hypothetical protein
MVMLATHYFIGGWVEPAAGLDLTEKINVSYPHWESIAETSDCFETLDTRHHTHGTSNVHSHRHENHISGKVSGPVKLPSSNVTK